MEQLNIQSIQYQSLTDRLNRLREQSDPQEIVLYHDSQLLKELAEIKINANNNTNTKTFKKNHNFQSTQHKALKKNISNISLRNQSNNFNLNLTNNKCYLDNSNQQFSIKPSHNFKRVTSQRLYLTNGNQTEDFHSNSPIRGFKQRFYQQKDQKKFNMQSPNIKNKNRQRLKLQTSEEKSSYKKSLDITDFQNLNIGSIKKNTLNNRVHTQNGNIINQIKRSQGRIVRNGYR